jgi:hypothetical protein
MHMQADTTAGHRKAASPEVRLDARIAPAVDRRLRMFALAERQTLSNALSALLDKALPPVDELAALLADSGSAQ